MIAEDFSWMFQGLAAEHKSALVIVIAIMSSLSKISANYVNSFTNPAIGFDKEYSLLNFGTHLLIMI